MRLSVGEDNQTLGEFISDGGDSTCYRHPFSWEKGRWDFSLCLWMTPKSYLWYLAEGTSHFTKVRQSFPHEDSSSALGLVTRSMWQVLPSVVCCSISGCYEGLLRTFGWDLPSQRLAWGRRRQTPEAIPWKFHKRRYSLSK